MTLGYKSIKNPITQKQYVIKSGDAGEVWKQRTNHKYIESKKENGDTIESRCDIIRGVSCRIDQGKPRQPSSILERLKKPSIAKPILTVPPAQPIAKKEEVKRIEQPEKPKGPTAEEILEAESKKKEADRKRKKAIELQIGKLFHFIRHYIFIFS